jgi:hypothetical protein
MATTCVEYMLGVAGYHGLVWLAGCHGCGQVEGPFADFDDADAWAATHRCPRGGR